MGGGPVLLARNSAAAEKRGRVKIPCLPAGRLPPNPPRLATRSVAGRPSFLPARAFGLARACPPKPRRRREARRQFRSKKVRISSNKRTSIKLSGILPTDSAARSAAENGNTGSPRTARLAKRRFETPYDFKYLLCPIKN